MARSGSDFNAECDAHTNSHNPNTHTTNPDSNAHTNSHNADSNASAHTDLTGTDTTDFPWRHVTTRRANG